MSQNCAMMSLGRGPMMKDSVVITMMMLLLFLFISVLDEAGHPNSLYIVATVWGHGVPIPYDFLLNKHQELLMQSYSFISSLSSDPLGSQLQGSFKSRSINFKGLQMILFWILDYIICKTLKNMIPVMLWGYVWIPLRDRFIRKHGWSKGNSRVILDLT